jgi:enoyl-[acyl-carrier protein] reductase II
MVDAVAIPVLAAGGINDRRGVKAAFALGAEGVFVGTRCFIATCESPAAEIVKEKIIASGFDDMVSVSGMQRSIRTRTASRLAELHGDRTNERDLDQEISAFGGLRPGMLEGRIDEGIISVNTGIDVIKSAPSVSTLVSELMGLNEPEAFSARRPKAIQSDRFGSEAIEQKACTAP